MIPRIVDTKWYPTPDNCQRSGEKKLLLHVAIAELQALYRKLPEGVRDVAELRGWDQFTVNYPHRRSELEVAQMQLRVFEQGLVGRASSGAGLNPQEVADLVARASVGG